MENRNIVEKMSKMHQDATQRRQHRRIAQVVPSGRSRVRAAAPGQSRLGRVPVVNAGSLRYGGRFALLHMRQVGRAGRWQMASLHLGSLGELSGGREGLGTADAHSLGSAMCRSAASGARDGRSAERAAMPTASSAARNSFFPDYHLLEARSQS